jgi:hypothetical protein
MIRKALTHGLGAAAIIAAVALGSSTVDAAPPSSSDPATSSTDAASTSSDPATTAPASSTPIAATNTVTLPLPVPLTVTISTGPGGALANVSVDPADGLVATKLRPGKVVFVNDTTGVKVTIQSHGNTQSVSARAGTLAQISGNGGWSGDVFGTGATTTVSYTVGDRGDGTPDITGVTSSDATAVVSPTQYGSGDDDDEQRSTARATVTFTNGSQSRTLSIRASVSSETNDDGTVGTQARVSVTLGRIRGVAQDAAVAAGAKTWTGMLCNGSTATINYTVNADGTLSNVTSTPAAIRSDVRGGEADIRISNDERVRIRVRLDNGQITVNVDPRFRCNSPLPSVNTPTSLGGGDDNGVDNGDDHGSDSGSHGGDDHGSDDGGSHGGSGGGRGGNHGGGDDNGGGHGGGQDD